MKDYIKITNIEKIGVCENCLSVGELAKVSFRITNNKSKNKDKVKLCENCLNDLLKYIIEE